MSPKEKAKELVGKLYYGGYKKPMFYYNAKQCALITVDEILNAICFNMYDEDAYNKEVSYWQEVKNEIELL